MKCFITIFLFIFGGCFDKIYYVKVGHKTVDGTSAGDAKECGSKEHIGYGHNVKLGDKKNDVVGGIKRKEGHEKYSTEYQRKIDTEILSLEKCAFGDWKDFCKHCKII